MKAIPLAYIARNLWVRRVTTLLTAGGDGSTRVWDLAARKERFKLVALDARDWAVIDDHGRFDASAGGIPGLVV